MPAAIEISIKVEPYWNVKTGLYLLLLNAAFIKVEPYWNVKWDYTIYPYWYSRIKVEPYWNVKALMGA